MVILELSSLFHLTLGCGNPVALQVKVSLAPSLTITSLLLRESSIFGGTANNTKTNYHYCQSFKCLLKFILNPTNISVIPLIYRRVYILYTYFWYIVHSLLISTLFFKITPRDVTQFIIILSLNNKMRV